MDWGHTLFAATEGLAGLLAAAATLPVLAFAGSPGRKIISCSPSIAAIAFFVLCCVLAGLPSAESSRSLSYLPSVGLVVTAVLVVPSSLGLRTRWWAALHIVTLAAALYLWFIGSLAISHDAT